MDSHTFHKFFIDRMHNQYAWINKECVVYFILRKDGETDLMLSSGNIITVYEDIDDVIEKLC